MLEKDTGIDMRETEMGKLDPETVPSRRLDINS